MAITSLLATRVRIIKHDSKAAEAKMAAEGSELAIEVRDVYKQYGRGRGAVKVLKGINASVPYHSM